MRNIIFITLTLCILASAQNWNLVWSDEFSEPYILTSNWGFEHGLVRNNEAQYYTINRTENARIEQGHLLIQARREQYSGASYTSASLISKGKRQFQYGRFEMKGRIPTDNGSWPAWWALGINDASAGWPKCGEIDMMEYYRQILLENIMDSEQHWTSSRDPLPSGFASQDHVWIMEWDENTITLSRDNVVKVKYDVNKATVGNYNPFRQPMYLILNLAIGGNSGGDPSKTVFPLNYTIDYVRVYQLN